VPFKEGSRYFYTRNSGLQNQSVLYSVTSLDGQPQLLLDPNTLSTDGTVALSGMQISNGGKLLAYSLSASGSDWQEWKVRDVETGKDLSDHLKWVKFSGASWAHDNSGFFYNRYDEPKGDSLKETNYFQEDLLPQDLAHRKATTLWFMNDLIRRIGCSEEMSLKTATT
jgi:prolyl oligopeptidase